MGSPVPGASGGQPKRVTFSLDTTSAPSSPAASHAKSSRSSSTTYTYMKDRTVESKPAIDIGIVAIGNIVGAKNKFRRILWSAILALSVCAMIYQIYDRTVLFLANPISVNMRETINHSLIFPALTICKQNPWNFTLIFIHLEEKIMAKAMAGELMPDWEQADHLSYLLGSGGLTVSQFWTTFAHDYRQLISKCYFGRGTECPDEAWYPVATVMGICTTFIPISGVISRSGNANSMYVSLRHDPEEEQLEGYKFVVHMPTSPPLYEILLHGHSLSTGSYAEVQLKLKVYDRINRIKRPCKEDDNYYTSVCMAECFSWHLFLRLDCTFPFMIGVRGKPCTKQSQYKEAMDEIDKLIVRGQWHMSKCKCDIRCNAYVISYRMELNHGTEKTNSSQIRMFYDDMNYELYDESYAYNLVSFLSDIGGSLGLLLGASLLTLIEITNSAIEVLHRYREKARKQRDKDKQLQHMGLW